MKNLPKYIILSLLALLASCKKETEKPKVRYESSTPSKEVVVKKDTAAFIIADLPVQFEGTNVLIHPIGKFVVSERSSKIAHEIETYEKDENFRISNSSQNEITGYLSNLKFQETGSDSLKVLADKPVIIQTATFLNTIAAKIKQQIMVYTLADEDTNKDGKLDTNDITTLYLSLINGSKFTKVSVELQELIDWNVIESKNRLYFRTIEDSNKNGAFDKEDKVFYHYVDLASKDWKVQDYSPL